MKSLNPVSPSSLDETFALVPSDSIYSGVLTAGVEQIVTVPTGAEFVIMTATNDYYVNYDTAATVPAGTISNAGGELNPITRYIGEITSIRIISPYTCYITLGFYKK